MFTGNGSIIEAARERRKQEIRNGMRRKGLVIGIAVTKTCHPGECACWECLTNPGPFCPFPEEHKSFVDFLLTATAQ